MTYFNFSASCGGEGDLPSSAIESPALFIVCRAAELTALRAVFGFDESTVIECTDLDESVRYAAFEGYDFISAVLLHGETFLPDELNLYAAAGRLVLVVPDVPSEESAALAAALIKLAGTQLERCEPDTLNRLYYMFWQGLLAQYSDLLESLEGAMEALSEDITGGKERNPFGSIDHMRRRSYSAKKYLRALSYLGAQMITDSNELLDAKHARLFKGIEIRMRRLYDFAESLYAFSGELLKITESRISMRTNETMNKLTLITLFFAPLTVITGIYGMNFRFMPELNWRLGYPIAIGVMLLVCAALRLIAKRKRWM
ncbi:MAG: hypothetical protein LBT21_04630 [Oscillospiraceae bacterium]|jgi:magnesium transporter|nr:hypothetical protein [Oscillospiraceae bacterium]